MRQIREAVLPMAASDEHLPKTVRDYRAKYKRVSRILEGHPELVEAVHEDLKKLSRGGRKGRRGDYTSETILRALVVHAIEGLSLRETVVLSWRGNLESLRHPRLQKTSGGLHWGSSPCRLTN